MTQNVATGAQTTQEDVKAELAAELHRITVAESLDGVLPVKMGSEETSTGEASDQVRQDADENGKLLSPQESARKRTRSQKGGSYLEQIDAKMNRNDCL